MWVEVVVFASNGADSLPTYVMLTVARDEFPWRAIMQVSQVAQSYSVCTEKLRLENAALPTTGR